MSLTHLPFIEQLSSRVIRILGCNPGAKTLQGTNSYLVGIGSKRVLIDTTGGTTGSEDGGDESSQMKEYINNLKKELETRNCHLQEILVTHRHLDHIGGVQSVLKDIVKTPIKVSKYKLTSMPEHDEVTNFSYLNDNDIIQTEGATLQAIYTPGHTEDHLCFFLKEENALFTGDCILGETSAVFEDLFDYMNSLKKIKEFNADIIYPGHGPVVKNALERIDTYINHRNQRNEQILEVLKHSDKPIDAEQIATKIYTDINPQLFTAACYSVLNHLTALKKQNLVVQIDDDYWVLKNKL